jgi:Ca-activated chloride channel family protein
MKKTLPVLSISVVLALALSGCVAGSDNNADNGFNGNGATNQQSQFSDDGCTHITIATSSEKVNLMEKEASAFKDSPEAKKLSKCVTVKPIKVASGDGTRILASNPSSWPQQDKEYWPTLWSPASTIWTNRVAAAGASGIVGTPKSFTHTPVVFGMPESMAKALGYPQKKISLTDIERLIQKGWGSVNKPIWGSFKISKTNPNTSTTGLSTILMQSYEAAHKTKGLTSADVDKAADFSRVFESGAIHYGDTTGNVLSTLYQETQSGAQNSGYVSAIAVEETSLLNYNQGNPDSHTVQPGEKLTPPKEKLVAVYPAGGSIWSDNPVTVLNAAWVTDDKKAAGQAFADFLQTEPAQTILPQFGFRPLMTSVPLGKLFTPEYGVDPKQPSTTLPQPDADVVSTALDQWTQLRKPSAVLELVDISNSMNEGIGDGRSKLDGAIKGVQSTVSHFRGSDEVGVWAFTDNLNSDIAPYIAPVRNFGALNADAESLSNSVEDLKRAPKGGTPLYDAILKAYTYMQQRAEPGRINAIVVLTDGEDSGSRTSLDSLLVKINSTAKEGGSDAPVRVFPIAYGASADKDVLGRIAKASGGQLFDATDPAKIDTVFTSVINNF